MTENLSKKEREIIDAFQKAFDLIKEGDGISLYCLMVKKEVDMVSTVENLKGSEQDIFSGMCGSHDDDKMSSTKNLLRNFFSYQASQLTKQHLAKMNGEEPKPIMKIEPKGDA